MKIGDSYYNIGERGYNDYTSMMGALVVLKLIAEVVLECPKTDNGGTELDGKFYQVDPQFVANHVKLKSFDCKLKNTLIEVTHKDMSHTVSVDFLDGCAHWQIEWTNWHDTKENSFCGLGNLTNVLSEVLPQ